MYSFKQGIAIILKNMKNKRILIVIITAYASILGGFLLNQAFAQTTSFPVSMEACFAEYGNPGHLVICHKNENDGHGRSEYVRTPITCRALFGGHLNDDGNPLVGHASDLMSDADGNCPGGESDETPDPSSSPDTSPTASPDASPSLIPSSSPSNSPQPPADSGTRSSLGYNVHGCSEQNFEVTMDLFRDGNPVEGVDVTFSYNPTVVATTNSNGRATAYFQKGLGTSVTASAPGYPTQTISIVIPNNCPQESPSTPTTLATIDITPQNDSGSGRGGQVLGATTLADTASRQTSEMALLVTAHAFFLAIGGLTYAYKA